MAKIIYNSTLDTCSYLFAPNLAVTWPVFYQTHHTNSTKTLFIVFSLSTQRKDVSWQHMLPIAWLNMILMLPESVMSEVVYVFREGFLTSVAKTLQKKVAGGAVSPGNLSLTEAESLEESMKKVTYYTVVYQAFRNSSVQRPKPTKPHSGLLNPSIHQSKWPTKSIAALE